MVKAFDKLKVCHCNMPPEWISQVYRADSERTFPMPHHPGGHLSESSQIRRHSFLLRSCDA